MACPCNSPKPDPPAPERPKTLKSSTVVTKKQCPKCGFWMGLVVTPATKERQYKCQNQRCNHIMGYP